MPTERRAEFFDTIGRRGTRLFARHKDTGRRITSRKFWGLPGTGYEREGYVLMTTAAPIIGDDPRGAASAPR